MIYLEQVCHKPPISFVLFEGPEFAPYRWSGYTSLSVKAYFNSINLEVGGYKLIEFPDGSSIVYNNQNDIFGNTLFGTMHHQLVGKIEFKDEKNGIKAEVRIGEDKGKAKDYFKGKIYKVE